MERNLTIKSGIILAVIIIVSAVITIGTYAFATGTVISACAQKNGEMYLIGPGFKHSKCGKGDIALSWNTAGQPGPKGDKGDPGVPGTNGQQGPKGDKGDPGTNTGGKNLHLFDANNQDLGILVDYSNAVVTFLSASKSFMNFTGPAPKVGIVLYESTDCTGISYAGPRSGNVLDSFVVPGINKFFKVTSPNTAAGPLQSELTSTGCQATSTNATTGTVMEFSAPFTLPLAAPLQVDLN